MYTSENEPNLNQGKQLAINKGNYNIPSSISELKNELSEYKNLSTAPSTVSDYKKLYQSNEKMYTLAKGIGIELHEVIDDVSDINKSLLNQQNQINSHAKSLINQNNSLNNMIQGKDSKESIQAIFDDSKTSMNSNKIFFFIWLFSLLLVCGLTFSSVYGNEVSILAYAVASIFIFITARKYLKWAFDKLYY
jgi:hypothetical protein